MLICRFYQMHLISWADMHLIYLRQCYSHQAINTYILLFSMAITINQKCKLIRLQFKQAVMSYHNAYEMKGILFKKPPPYTQMPNRSIVTNIPDGQVCNNEIKTSKYTILDFIPLNLMIQFSKLPNIYFLIIGVMQMIRPISISMGFPVIYIPLGIVVSVSAIKDFYQDLKRKKSDEEINNSKALVLREEGYVEIKWKDILIGDIIKVKQNEQFPADIILLQSSEEKLNCFIETKNLDGETNLKFKQVKFEVAQNHLFYLPPNEQSLHSMHSQFSYQRPNPFIYSFTGSYQSPKASQPVPLDCNNVILRGCMLRITHWVVGVVVYTGVDSKIMLNSNKSRSKKSRLEFRMGIIVIVIFSFQMLVTFIVSLFAILSTPKSVIEIGMAFSLTRELLLRWGGWILLFTNFVPISLIVSLEMVKYIQGINISNSRFMTSMPAEVTVQTSTLNEELGQIQHVFSDKTGTLTKNYMSFKYMVVGEQSYGKDDGSHLQQIPNTITNVDFHDFEFMRIVRGDQSKWPPLLKDMLISFALCHNVIIQQSQTGEKKYNASSPDELAFINFAKYCGWQFQGLDKSNNLCIATSQGIVKYKILHTIDFDSDRKRMSVILEKDDQIFVYCKGADNIILDRVKKSVDGHVEQVVMKNVEQWSTMGLRTLLFAKREIKKKDYEKWARMYASSLSKLQKQEKAEKVQMKKNLIRRASSINIESTGLTWEKVTKRIIQDQTMQEHIMNEAPYQIINKLLNDNTLLSQRQKIFIQKYFQENFPESTCSSKQLQNMLERQFDLIGSTAIEDQLQQNVKDTIRVIREAGVKVWMLTGDKKETAINIGVSCGLVTGDMAVVCWNKTLEATVQERKKYPQNRDCCLVATGQDLLTPLNELILLELVKSCKAIICCRVTPKQKQDMVWLMRKNKCTTLGIGDGANDVNMINTAHVGIGIKGVQGAQAALCSDYAISQFQILRELMLYHGRQSYRKNSQLILFNFYKNFFLVLPQLWYGFNNHFSSQTIYDPWIYQLYNVVFTSLPVIVFAIFDQQHSVRESLANPTLYRLGLDNLLFNKWRVMFWFVCPAIFALVLSLLNFQGLGQTIDNRGFIEDLMTCGMNIFAQCVFITNFKILTMSYSRSIGLYFFVLFGIASFYVLSYCAQRIIPFGDMQNVLYNQVMSLNYWFTILATTAFIVVFETIVARWQDLLHAEQSRNVQFQQIEIPLIEKTGERLMEDEH